MTRNPEPFPSAIPNDEDPNWHVCDRCGDRFYAFSDWDFCIPCMETVKYELREDF